MNHHSDDLPSRRITISKINHYDYWAFQQRISISTNDHLPTKSTFDEDSPLQRTNIRRRTMFRRRNIFEPVALHTQELVIDKQDLVKDKLFHFTGGEFLFVKLLCFIVIFISILINLLHQSCLGCSLRFLDDCTTGGFFHCITFLNKRNIFELPGFGASGKWFIAITVWKS